MLCDRRMNLNIDGKVYKTVVRPALVYGTEIWECKNAKENKLEVAEKRLLRCMSWVAKLDRIKVKHHSMFRK